MTAQADVSLNAASAVLRSGNPAIFPTDTVYGLGVSVHHASGPGRLYELKGRPSGKPVAWLVGSVDDLLAYGQDVPAAAVELARTYWPGPLTLVVKASPRVPAAFQSEAGTIGLRMPDNAMALELIRRVGCPLATTSANVSGEPPAHTALELNRGLTSQVVTVVDDSPASGLASTVLDCTGYTPVMLREGAISADDVAATSMRQENLMAKNVDKSPFEIASTDNVSTVRGFIWSPAGTQEPRAVVQLIHGMAEYIDRYDDFARFLAGEGFVVVGHDHIGHGQTQPDDNLKGCIPVDGKETIINDAFNVQEKVISVYPCLPVFVLGHSMGSFVARAMLRRRGKDFAGVIVCGTGFVPASKSLAGNALARTIATLQGDSVKSPLLFDMADGAYSKAIQDARTPFDWLNSDPDGVDDYIDDPNCGVMFSAGGYAMLTDLVSEVCDPALILMIPKYVPLLYIAGGQDPVGDCGKGVYAAARLALNAGAKDVQVKLYMNMRHEILNEPEHRQVYDDVLQWINYIIR